MDNSILSQTNHIISNCNQLYIKNKNLLNIIEWLNEPESYSIYSSGRFRGFTHRWKTTSDNETPHIIFFYSKERYYFWFGIF